MQAAAKAAGQHPGDEQVIPACPSSSFFDQFASFEARGEHSAVWPASTLQNFRQQFLPVTGSWSCLTEQTGLISVSGGGQ